MQQKKKQPRINSPDRSGDRWIHDIMSAGLTKGQDTRKDAAIDIGVREHGSHHRAHFPHRNIGEACGYLCFQDIVNGRKMDIATNTKVTIGHFIVDRLPSKLKEKMKLVQQVAGIFG